jgi:uncharacterized protein HemX
MLQTDELLNRIGQLERANRFWKGLAFGLAAALVLLLLLGAALGGLLYFQAQEQRLEAEREIMEREAVLREELARRQAVEAAERAKRAAEKLKAQP